MKIISALALLAGFMVIFTATKKSIHRYNADCIQSDDALHRAVMEIHNKQDNVGLGAVIFGEKGFYFTDFIGYADLEHRVSVHSGTKFGIASITKLFTAVTVLLLHAEHEIDLDAPVRDYLPEFPKKSGTPITVRMLATHRSGIPHPRERTPELFSTHYSSAIEALEVFRDDSLLFEPGTERRYSSSNYNLLAAVVEKLTGQLFTEVVREKIFTPLDLTGTSFDNILKPLSHRSRRYSYYHPWTYEESPELYRVPVWDYSFNTGGGNIISTAADVAKFGAALWEPGLLPERELELLYTKPWFGEPHEEGMFLYVTGANPGVQAGLTVYPDKKLASVVLSNTWGKGSNSGEMVELANVLSLQCMGDTPPK